MKTDSENPDDLAIIERLQSAQHVKLDARAEQRIRKAVLDRISDSSNILDWLLRPLWRPVLAVLLPFATGLAFGQSDYLDDSPLLVKAERSVELLTSLDAAHGLIEYYATEEDSANAD